jgi:predicted nucleic acid-binding Zn ribbon protein
MRDDEFEDEDEDEGDDEGDAEDGEDDATTDECPHCGAAVYDDAEQCPTCGKYLSREDAPSRLPAAWILIGVAVCLVIVILWALGR